MAAIEYPADLPCPQTAPLTPEERRQLSPLDGARIARARQRDWLALQTVSFTFSFAQGEVFRAWWKATLIYGGAWFASDWSAPQGGINVRRFITVPRRDLIPGYGWRVSALCEVRGAGLLPQEAEPTFGGFDPSKVRDGTFWVLTNDNRSGVFTDPGISPGFAGNDNLRSINGRTDKRYFEFVWSANNGSNGQIIVGCGSSAFPITTKVGYNTANPAVWGVGYDCLGEVLENGGVVDTLSTYGLGAVIGVAVNPANGHTWFSKNGAFGGDPAAGTGWSAVAPVGELFAMVGGDNVNVGAVPLVLYAGTGNFTSADQVYAAPSGFTPWDD